jgi:hypothetical protein
MPSLIHPDATALTSLFGRRAPFRFLRVLYEYDFTPLTFTAPARDPDQVVLCHAVHEDARVGAPEGSWVYVARAISHAALTAYQECRVDTRTTFLQDRPGCGTGCHLLTLKSAADDDAVLSGLRLQEPGGFDPSPLLPRPGIYLYAVSDD